ncbi:MAG: hypothetical protein Q9185_003804 [Variospora sp. 1 TL-2023]
MNQRVSYHLTPSAASHRELWATCDRANEITQYLMPIIEHFEAATVQQLHQREASQNDIHQYSTRTEPGAERRPLQRDNSFTDSMTSCISDSSDPQVEVDEHAALTTNETYCIQFDVLRTARELPLMPNRFSRPRRHPFSSFEAQLPTTFPAINVDAAHLAIEKPPSRKEGKPDLFCVFRQRTKAV